MADAPSVVTFDAFFDGEAGVWVATSQESMTTEAASREALLERLRVIVPDVLEARLGRPPHEVKVVVNWQEMRTFDRTELLVA